MPVTAGNSAGASSTSPDLRPCVRNSGRTARRAVRGERPRRRWPGRADRGDGIPWRLAAWKRERRPRWRRPRAAAVARPAVQPAVPAESVLPEASRIADDAKKVA